MFKRHVVQLDPKSQYANYTYAIMTGKSLFSSPKRLIFESQNNFGVKSGPTQSSSLNIAPNSPNIESPRTLMGVQAVRFITFPPLLNPILPHRTLYLPKCD
jgi:hypothetical protein